MKFILAPDSFKESMTAKEACRAMEKGIKSILPDALCVHMPLADGGEGTMQALADAANGCIYQTQVIGPLGLPVMAAFAILGDGETVVIELASASGLQLIDPADRNPMFTTTFGTGELIEAALNKGIRKLIIGLGGSATNDGGAGIAMALGVKFLNKTGDEIGFGGAALADIVSIDTSGLTTRDLKLSVEIACDVTNPLTGVKGASAVFGHQKGATPQMIKTLDASLKHYAAKILEYTGKDIEHMPGAGAAGGAGAGLVAFLNGTLISGVELVIKHSGIAAQLLDADYIFTGEGSIDRQTLYGKTIAGLAALAKPYQKPLFVFAGQTADLTGFAEAGISAIYCITPPELTLPEALAAGGANLERTVREVVSKLM